MKKIGIIILLIAVGLSSFFIGTQYFSNPESYKDTIEVLNNKQANVMALTAASAAASTALSAKPGDTGTPIANQIAEISTYLFLVTCVVFLEKFLLTVMGYVVFKIVIPSACILGILYMLKGNISVRNIAIKLAVAGLLCISIVPMSVGLTTLIEETNEIDMESIEVKYEEEEKDGWLGILEKVVDNATNMPEKAKKVAVDLVDDIAVMLVTSCVIPVLVMVSYIVIIKGVFKFDMSSSDIKKIDYKK